MNQYVFCDPNLCIGCSMCERRCIMSHQGLGMKEVNLEDPMQRQRCKSYRLPEMKVSVHCRHCEASPCLHACPVGAIEKIEHNGATMIYIHEDKCIGCRECVFACPFGAVYMGPLEDGRIVATKCDLCKDIEEGPQCVKYCPKKALTVVKPEVNRGMIYDKQVATATVNADDDGSARPDPEEETEAMSEETAKAEDLTKEVTGADAKDVPEEMKEDTDHKADLSKVQVDDETVAEVKEEDQEKLLENTEAEEVSE